MFRRVFGRYAARAHGVPCRTAAFAPFAELLAMEETYARSPRRSDMIFVGNPGMTQIYSGSVKRVVDTPPWCNVLDPSFNPHVREPGIAQAWVVGKPTRHGIISALELYDEDEGQIALIVSEREAGAWRGILTSLSRQAA